MILAEPLDECRSWLAPRNSMNVQSRSAAGKPGQDTLQQRTLPAIEFLSRKRRIQKGSFEKEQPIFWRHVDLEVSDRQDPKLENDLI